MFILCLCLKLNNEILVVGVFMGQDLLSLIIIPCFEPRYLFVYKCYLRTHKRSIKLHLLKKVGIWYYSILWYILLQFLCTFFRKLLFYLWIYSFNSWFSKSSPCIVAIFSQHCKIKRAFIVYRNNLFGILFVWFDSNRLLNNLLWELLPCKSQRSSP